MKCRLCGHNVPFEYITEKLKQIEVCSVCYIICQKEMNDAQIDQSVKIEDYIDSKVTLKRLTNVKNSEKYQW